MYVEPAHMKGQLCILCQNYSIRQQKMLFCSVRGSRTDLRAVNKCSHKNGRVGSERIKQTHTSTWAGGGAPAFKGRKGRGESQKEAVQQWEAPRVLIWKPGRNPHAHLVKGVSKLQKHKRTASRSVEC